MLKAEAERLGARLTKLGTRRTSNDSTGKSKRPLNEEDQRKTLASRFLEQSHTQNAADPDFRHAQTLVAPAISIARARYPDDPNRAAHDVEAKRQDVAARIANGDKIAAIQIGNRQTEHVREVTQDKAMKRGGLSR